MRFVVGSAVSDSSNNGPLPSSLADLKFLPTEVTVDKSFTFDRR